jgi:hypothetical protein
MANDDLAVGGVCRVCGCTDEDCTRCVEKTGEPCWWFEPDLCSACALDLIPPLDEAGWP